VGLGRPDEEKTGHEVGRGLREGKGVQGREGKEGERETKGRAVLKMPCKNH